MEFIEKCCSSIYNSVEVSVALLVGTAVAAAVIYLYSRRAAVKSEKEGVCRSSSCFRCNAGDSFQELTRKKFAKYLDEYRNPDLLSNLKEAIFDQRVNEAEDDLQKPTLLWVKSIQPKIWYDPADTHERDVEILESNFSVILEEYRRLAGRPGWIVNQRDGGCWKIYHLMSQGIFTVNATECPRTVDVLGRLKSLMRGTVFGYASFSVLEPGTVVAPHFGATNCRIRCHLGLQVDPTTCHLTAGNEERSWMAGKCLLFDDSFLHGAHHGGVGDCEPRVVLMVDLWHSDLSEEEIQCIHSVYSSNLIFECTSFTKTD